MNMMNAYYIFMKIENSIMKPGKKLLRGGEIEGQLKE
jgi:hypothetical protein